MIDVALDARLTRRMSVGMKAYTAELAQRLPIVEPQLSFAALEKHAEVLSVGEQIGLPLTLLRMRPRLTHFLSLYAPLFAPKPFVITIHDLIHLCYPEFFKRKVRPYYQTVVRSLCSRAARIITDDERTIDDLERFLGVAPEKVRVIPLGCDDAYRNAAEEASEGEPPPERPFFLYAGNHLPHKDLPTLLGAWASLPQHHAVDLYLTGNDDLPPQWRVLRNWGEIRFVGDVTTEQLASLYRRCIALVHPALREGFGLPMLEAATAGARVIACEDSVPMMLRTYVDRFPARDSRALCALMQRALESDARHPRLREVAAGFTWDRCARATAEVYREVLEEHPLR